MNSGLEDKEVSDLLKKIFTPLLLCMGTFGNLISIKIFCQPNMKKYTTFRSLNDLSCKLNSFFVYFFTHFSSMLLALMSIDRTLAILSRRSRAITKPETTLRIFFITGLLLALINVHFLFFTHLIDYEMPPSEMNLSLGHLNYSNETIQTIKVCYGEFNSYYFVYITKVFPWY